MVITLVGPKSEGEPTLAGGTNFNKGTKKAKNNNMLITRGTIFGRRTNLDRAHRVGH